MDRSDAESENSSDNSFNELVTVATAGGYAILSMTKVPPQVNPAYHQQDLKGRQWVANILADRSRCLDSFRMQPKNFQRLHSILSTWYGLKSTRHVDSMKALGMFLWACGTGQSQRQIHERFRRGLGTCSKIFGLVLNAMVPFANVVLRPKDYNYAVVPYDLTEYTPFFDGCIGAIDGTHIKVIVDEAVHDDYTNRKGSTTQNVCAVCDFDMRFTYIGVGTEGSAHDMRVMRKAQADPNFPHPPAGRYYLVDSGYALRPGYMTPYPRRRYHVREFRNRAPGDAEDVFNRHHSKLRNVIERTFGAAKGKWQMLRGVPHYPEMKQSQIIMALFALHNYVHELEGPKKAGGYRQPQGLGCLSQVAAVALSPDATMEEVREWITLGLGILGKR